MELRRRDCKQAMPYCSALRDAINCGRFRRRCTQPRASTVCTGFLSRAAFAPGFALRSLRIKLKQSGRQAAGQVRLGLLLPPGSPAIASLFPPKVARALPPSSTCPKPLPARTFPAGGAPAALRFAPPSWPARLPARPGTAAACASPAPAPLGVTLLPGRWRWAARLVCLGTGRWALGALGGPLGG